MAGKEIKSELTQIPSVGPNMAMHLIRLGYTTIESLRGQVPEQMYERDCAAAQSRLDRCVLYVYRAAVYFAESESPEPEKLKWWNWKDGEPKT